MQTLNKIMIQLKQFAQWFDLHVLFPVMQWIVSFFSKKLDNRIIKYNMVYDWKEKTLNDFRAWIANLPETPLLPEKVLPDSVDLFTLLSEFSALRQEIHLQNREQNSTLKTINSLNSFINSYQETSNLFKEKTKDLSELERNIRLSCEKKTVLPFLDIRDALARGLEASKAAGKRRRFFKKNQRLMDGIAEGYEMAIRRFDRALSYLNVSQIKSVGNPFDPKRMKAVDKRSVPEMEKGLVVEEYLTGFARGNEILRAAEVIVNE